MVLLSNVPGFRHTQPDGHVSTYDIDGSTSLFLFRIFVDPWHGLCRFFHLSLFNVFFLSCILHTHIVPSIPFKSLWYSILSQARPSPRLSVSFRFHCFGRPLCLVHRFFGLTSPISFRFLFLFLVRLFWKLFFGSLEVWKFFGKWDVPMNQTFYLFRVQFFFPSFEEKKKPLERYLLSHMGDFFFLLAFIKENGVRVFLSLFFDWCSTLMLWYFF